MLGVNAFPFIFPKSRALTALKMNIYQLFDDLIILLLTNYAKIALSGKFDIFVIHLRRLLCQNDGLVLLQKETMLECMFLQKA